MPRLVDADKVADAIEWLNEYDFVLWHDVMECINKLPIVDVVRHGQWIYNDKPMLGNAYGSYYCSECGAFHPHRERYCPHCGADMREVENDKIN